MCLQLQKNDPSGHLIIGVRIESFDLSTLLEIHDELCTFSGYENPLLKITEHFLLSNEDSAGNTSSWLRRVL